MSGPEPVTFEYFLGAIVWFFKTYFMVMLGVVGFIVVVGSLIGFLVYLRYRKNRNEILNGTALTGTMRGRFPKI